MEKIVGNTEDREKILNAINTPKTKKKLSHISCGSSLSGEKREQKSQVPQVISELNEQFLQKSERLIGKGSYSVVWECLYKGYIYFFSFQKLKFFLKESHML